MLLTDGNYSSGSYGFGFNGQKKDDEINGTGNSINFKYRMHDARIGRFFAVDPLAFKYPYNSQYAFSENSVIAFVELEGLEKLYFHNIGREVDISNMSSEEVKAKIAEVNATYGTNFKWKDDWYVENADKSEYWTLHQKKAYWSRVSMGTYYERYKHKALYHGGSMYASGKDAKRGVLEYVVAYNEQFVGAEGRDAAIQFMVSAALTVATGGTSAFIIKAGYSGVKFLARAGTAVALDELLSISGENTLITKLAEEIGGEKAGQAIEIVEWSIKVANAKQNLVKGTFKLKNGDILEGTFDVAKGVFTDLSLPNSLKGKEEKDDSKENEN